MTVSFTLWGLCAGLHHRPLCTPRAGFREDRCRAGFGQSRDRPGHPSERFGRDMICDTFLCPGLWRLARPSQQSASNSATPTSRRRRATATRRATRSTRRWNGSPAASQPPFSDEPRRSNLWGGHLAWYVCSQGRTSSETDKSDPQFASRRRIRISPSLLAALGGSTPKSNVVSFSTVRSACIATRRKTGHYQGHEQQKITQVSLPKSAIPHSPGTSRERDGDAPNVSTSRSQMVARSSTRTQINPIH